MAANNREIELKFTAHSTEGKSLTANYVFGTVLKSTEKLGIVDKVHHNLRSSDVYWHGSRGGKAQSVRVRTHPGHRNGGEVTVKTKDNGTNENRVEKDLHVDDPVQAISLFNELLGPRAATVTKTYSLILTTREGESISVYEVEGDSKQRLFVEAETDTEERLAKLVEEVKNSLSLGQIVLESHDGSIYETFVMGG